MGNFKEDLKKTIHAAEDWICVTETSGLREEMGKQISKRGSRLNLKVRGALVKTINYLVSEQRELNELIRTEIEQTGIDSGAIVKLKMDAYTKRLGELYSIVGLSEFSDNTEKDKIMEKILEEMERVDTRYKDDGDRYIDCFVDGIETQVYGDDPYFKELVMVKPNSEETIEPRKRSIFNYLKGNNKEGLEIKVLVSKNRGGFIETPELEQVDVLEYRVSTSKTLNKVVQGDRTASATAMDIYGVSIDGINESTNGEEKHHIDVVTDFRDNGETR